MTFELIPAAEIDRLKWDSCVHYATQPSFSGYTWFLQAVSRDWAGLVEGDYETVLPLFHSRDWLGRRRYPQPWYLAPSGPYSQHVMSRPRILALLKALPLRTSDLLLTWEGALGAEGIRSRPVTRHLLRLYEPYEELAPAFALPPDRQTGDWHYGSPGPEQVTAFWRAHSPAYPGRDQDLHRYHRIIYQAMHRGQALSSSVGREGQRPEAMAYFIASHGYIFRLLSAARPGPQGEAALHELYRGIVETYAGRPVILDFNGDERGAALGATSLRYTRVDGVG
jgi:hypothetical protein